VDGSARTYAVDIDHHMDIYTHTYTHTHTYTQTDIHTHRQTYTHTDTQTHRHTHTQTHRHTDTQTLVKKSKSGLIFSGKRSTAQECPPHRGERFTCAPTGGRTYHRDTPRGPGACIHFPERDGFWGSMVSMKSFFTCIEIIEGHRRS